MSQLMDAIHNALEVAKAERDALGPTETASREVGRYISLAITELEKAEDWARRARGVGIPRNPGYPSDVDLEEAISRGRDLPGAAKVTE